MNDPKSRPAIRKSSKDIADYDVIFLGYPIWWNLAPRIINTFIESYHLKNKTIILFATSGSSSITNSMATLKKSYPDLIWKEGKLLNGMNEKDIREWISINHSSYFAFQNFCVSLFAGSCLIAQYFKAS